MSATPTLSDIGQSKDRAVYLSQISSVLSYAILLGGLLTIALALYMVVSTYSPLPYWDGWTQIEVAANGQSPLSPGWLWRQHNEHRLVIPKLFLATDLLLFQARQAFLLASIFVIQLLHLALLSWSMWVLGGWRGALWRAGTGLAAFCLFCPSQRENLVWGFQVCFVLPPLFATLSFVALILYWIDAQHPVQMPRSRFLVVSILAALGASYSLSNGSLLWPLLVAAALYLRLRVGAVLSIAAAGVVSTALYLYHYVRPQEHADPLASLSAPVALFKYVAVYFVSSWIHVDTLRAEVILLAGVVLAIAALLPALRYVRAFRPFAIQLVLTVAFCIGTALITAAGRVNFGLGQALASRYQTIALLFWGCLGLLWLGSAFFAQERMRYAFLIMQLCILVVFARGAATARYSMTEARRHAFAQKAITASLITGVRDPATLSEAYPRMDMLQLTVPYLKVSELSVFAGSAGSELGKPLKSVFPLAGDDDCIGGTESVVRIMDPGRPGVRILGWAWDRKHRQPPSTVVVTTNDIITGLGAIGKWRPAVRAQNPEVSSSYVGFVAFLPAAAPDDVVRLYAILRDGTPEACYLPLN